MNATAAASEPIDLGWLSRLGVTELRGVGEKKASALAKAEISNLLDLLTHYPRRYLDRTREARIADLVEGEEASVLVHVIDSSSRRVRGGKV
ncbi:MAG: DNA helicase RecG, partial [Acidimicrobiia bacterium]|nr:DNA helicase RecG [Acidimicrobiia bacterium]